MSKVRSFDPTVDTLNLGGVGVTGYSDSKFTLTPNNSRSTVTEGIDGEISVNVDSRFAGTLTVNLMQNSSMCARIDAWIYNVKTTRIAFFPVSIQSLSSNAQLNTIGWIQDQADFSVEQETGTRSFVIGVADSRLLPIGDANQAIQAYDAITSIF